MLRLASEPNVIVNALAGTGKTFTLKTGNNQLHGLPRPKDKKLTEEQEAIVAAICPEDLAPGKCHMTSFSNDATEQLIFDTPAGVGGNSTYGMGLACAKKAGLASRVEPGDWKYGAHLTEFLKGIGSEADKRWPGFRMDTLELCKKARLELYREMTPEQVQDLADHYGIDVPGGRLATGSPMTGLELVTEALNYMLKAGLAQSDKFDYVDMVYIPTLLCLIDKKYDTLFVDEYQDMGKAQQEICYRSARRIVAIGDPNQAIYGFIGADANATQSFCNALSSTFRGVKLLPLTYTRRCGKAIVEEANKLVPELKALPEAPDGLVRKISCAEFTPDKSLTPRDMMICPTNAPLISLMFRLTDRGIKAYVRKSDIVKRMCTYCDRYADKDIGELRKAIDRILEQAQGNSRKARMQRDQYGCLKKICERCDTPQKVVFTINGMFANDNYPGAIRLSTVHRSKGLEADRIIFWEWDRCGQYAELPWEFQQAKNLEYVGKTRARHELVLCRSDGR